MSFTRPYNNYRTCYKIRCKRKVLVSDRTLWMYIVTNDAQALRTLDVETLKACHCSNQSMTRRKRFFSLAILKKRVHVNSFCSQGLLWWILGDGKLVTHKLTPGNRFRTVWNATSLVSLSWMSRFAKKYSSSLQQGYGFPWNVSPIRVEMTPRTPGEWTVKEGVIAHECRWKTGMFQTNPAWIQPTVNIVQEFVGESTIYWAPVWNKLHSLGEKLEQAQSTELEKSRRSKKLKILVNVFIYKMAFSKSLWTLSLFEKF